VNGSLLDGLVSEVNDFRKKHVKQDVRIEPDAEQDEADYPWVIFTVLDDDEDGNTGVVKAMVEFTLIGKLSGETKNDDLLEQMKEALIGEFGGHRKTWGQYDADGNVDPSEGIRMTCSYLSTSSATDDLLDEVIQSVTFRFAYLRE